MISSIVKPTAAVKPRDLREFLNYIYDFCSRQCNRFRLESSPMFNTDNGGVYVLFIDSQHLYYFQYFDGMWHAHANNVLDGRMTDRMNGAKRDDQGNLHLPEAAE